MSLTPLRNIPFTRKLVLALGAIRAKAFIAYFEHHVQTNDTIVDIGAGGCDITGQLMQHYQVTPLDIKNLSFIAEISPIVYDGKVMPFADKSFDTALLLTVLHHAPDPENILREAKRIAGRVIIIEDVYSNVIHKYATFFMDSLLNLEFFGHPHTNKTDAQWRQAFIKLGLTIVDKKAMRSLVILRHRMYVLEPDNVASS